MPRLIIIYLGKTTIELYFHENNRFREMTDNKFMFFFRLLTYFTESLDTKVKHIWGKPELKFRNRWETVKTVKKKKPTKTPPPPKKNNEKECINLQTKCAYTPTVLL